MEGFIKQKHPELTGSPSDEIRFSYNIQTVCDTIITMSVFLILKINFFDLYILEQLSGYTTEQDIYSSVRVDPSTLKYCSPDILGRLILTFCIVKV